MQIHLNLTTARRSGNSSSATVFGLAEDFNQTLLPSQGAVDFLR